MQNHRFPWKMVLYSSSKFLSFVPIFKYSEDSSQVFGGTENKILENYNLKRNFLESFMVCFASSKNWYSLRKFWIFERCTNIQLLRRFNLKKILNKFIGNSNKGRTFAESFNEFLVYREKWFFIFRSDLAFYRFVQIFNHSEHST